MKSPIPGFCLFLLLLSIGVSGGSAVVDRSSLRPEPRYVNHAIRRLESRISELERRIVRLENR